MTEHRTSSRGSRWWKILVLISSGRGSQRLMLGCIGGAPVVIVVITNRSRTVTSDECSTPSRMRVVLVASGVMPRGSPRELDRSRAGRGQVVKAEVKLNTCSVSTRRIQEQPSDASVTIASGLATLVHNTGVADHTPEDGIAEDGVAEPSVE